MNNLLSPYSLRPECLHGFDGCGTTRRNVTGQQNNTKKQEHDTSKDRDIYRADLEQQACQQLSGGNRTECSDEGTEEREPHSVSNYQAEHAAALCSQGDANTELVGALCYQI